MIRPVAALLGLALAAVLPAQKGDAGGKVPEPLPAMKTEFEKLQAAQRAAVQKLTQTDEYKKAVEDKDQDALKALRDKNVPQIDGDKFVERAFTAAALVKGDARLPYYMFAATAGKPEVATRVIDVLQKDHIESPKLLEVFDNFGALRAVEAARAKEFLDAVIAKNPSKEIKGWGYYLQARNLQRNRQASAEDKQKAQELIEQAEKVAEGTPSHDLFAAPRFQKEKLQIGMACPDIAGDDVDGVPFKLSDYRGKVVVIDFWGFW